MTPTETPLLNSIFPELRELSPTPPRREMLPGLHLKAIARSPLAILLPFMVIFTLFPLLMLVTTKAQKTVRQQVAARVIQVERFGQNQIFVKYRFAANGRDFTGSGLAVGNSPLQNRRQGETLPIRFDQANPTKNAPVTNELNEEIIWPLFLLFPLIAFLFIAPLFVPQLRAIRLARSLLSRGNLAQGQVKFIKSSALQTPMMPGGHSQIFYAWTDADGTLQKGVMKCDNAWLVQQFPVDSPVVVAYDAKKPGRSVLLEPFVA